MRPIHLPFILAALLALGACAGAGPTPYQPAERPGAQGYSEQRLDADRWRISVTGNRLTPRETVEDYLLFRAAELTLQAGRDHFLLQERQTDSDTIREGYGGYGGYGGPGWGGAWGPGWAWAPGWHSGWGVGTGYHGSRHGVGFGLSSGGGAVETRYSTTAVVVARPGPAPPERGDAYDARSVIDQLDARLLRPQPR